jgi:exosome complex component RRP40
VSIHHSSTDTYHATISDFAPIAALPHLSFEGASRKTRPQLVAGALVYARVSLANKHMDPELECVSSSTGKSDGLGPLNGGMLFTVSLAMSRRLMLPKPLEQGGLVILDELGAVLAFEIAVGRNGKVWVDSNTIKTTLAIGKAIQKIDSEALGVDDQKKLARRLAKDL